MTTVAKLFNPDWQRELLICPNARLERLYQHESMPCLALLIARNYRLLKHYENHPEKNANWRKQANKWIKRYWQAQGGGSSLLEHLEALTNDTREQYE